MNFIVISQIKWWFLTCVKTQSNDIFAGSTTVDEVRLWSRLNLKLYKCLKPEYFVMNLYSVLAKRQNRLLHL